MVKNTEVNFYKIHYDQFNKIFPRLIESIVNKGNRMVIFSEEEKQIKEVDDLLWTYAQLSFLPHATYKDDYKKDNLVYITNQESDNANGANFVTILSDSYMPRDLSKYEKYFFFYSDNTIQDTKERVKRISEMGGKCNYIAQDKSGQWTKSGKLL